MNKNKHVSHLNTSINIKEIVLKAFKSFQNNPPDLREIGDQDGETMYVKSTLSSYERTVSDILSLFPKHNTLKGVNILELGAFLGIVSKSLSLVSANIIACDIPEFFARENVKKYYKAMGIETHAFNLRDYHIPFPSLSQDCVIACEIFEHLNFNPLPVFAEINRVLRPGGFFYIAMPNGAYLIKRINYLISGIIPGFTVDELFAQLNPNNNMVVGLHWKEYSLSQTIQMVTPIGFELFFSKTCNDVGPGYKSKLKILLQKLIPGGHTQVVIFKKISEFKSMFFKCADS